MEVGEDAAMKIAHELPEEGQGSVSGTVEERDAKERTAQRALKGFRDSASLTEVVVDASLVDARKERKGALCSAKHTVVVNGARTLVAPKARREARRSVKDMEEVKDARFKRVILAPRVFMEVLISAWLTAVVRDVRFLNALRALEEGLTSASGTVEGRGASLKDVGKARRVVLIFARRMEEGSVVLGVMLRLSMRVNLLLVLVPRLREVRLVFVHSIPVWLRITGFTEE